MKTVFVVLAALVIAVGAVSPPLHRVRNDAWFESFLETTVRSRVAASSKMMDPLMKWVAAKDTTVDAAKVAEAAAVKIHRFEAAAAVAAGNKDTHEQENRQVFVEILNHVLLFIKDVFDSNDKAMFGQNCDLGGLICDVFRLPGGCRVDSAQTSPDNLIQLVSRGGSDVISGLSPGIQRYVKDATDVSEQYLKDASHWQAYDVRRRLSLEFLKELSSCDTQNCNHRVVTFTLARATEAGEDNMAKCSGVKDFPVATAYENPGWGKNPDDKCNPPAPEFLFHNAENCLRRLMLGIMNGKVKFTKNVSRFHKEVLDSMKASWAKGDSGLKNLNVFKKNVLAPSAGDWVESARPANNCLAKTLELVKAVVQAKLPKTSEVYKFVKKIVSDSIGGAPFRFRPFNPKKCHGQMGGDDWAAKLTAAYQADQKAKVPGIDKITQADIDKPTKNTYPSRPKFSAEDLNALGFSPRSSQEKAARVWAEKDGYDRAQHGSRKTDKTVKQDNANKAKPLEKMHWGSGSAMWVMPMNEVKDPDFKGWLADNLKKWNDEWIQGNGLSYAAGPSGTSAEFAQLADYFMLNRRKFWHCRLFEGLLAQMVLYNHHSYVEVAEGVGAVNPDGQRNEFQKLTRTHLIDLVHSQGKLDDPFSLIRTCDGVLTEPDTKMAKITWENNVPKSAEFVDIAKPATKMWDDVKKAYKTLSDPNSGMAKALANVPFSNGLNHIKWAKGDEIADQAASIAKLCKANHFAGTSYNYILCDKDDATSSAPQEQTGQQKPAQQQQQQQQKPAQQQQQQQQQQQKPAQQQQQQQQKPTQQQQQKVNKK